MAYSELIKNFERVRDYMREFYVYGFKSREEYEQKSARSYDNERRRIESYLGDYMGFRQTPSGKQMFLSIDSRAIPNNPLYNALKAKSFTDGDITLHFILFDILHTPETALTVSEITEQIDTAYLSAFRQPMLFDESTVRKKLKEYETLGLLCARRQGRRVVYSRTPDTDLTGLEDALAFFSEAGLCGVVGSFLLDRTDAHCGCFTFKHHYITHALESDILCRLLEAISDQRCVTIRNHSHRSGNDHAWVVVPLQIFVSVQSGRRYLMSYSPRLHKFQSYRLDCITSVVPGEAVAQFDALRQTLAARRQYMWGVLCSRSGRLEHVEFTIHIGDGEEHIVRRLEREKRCGTVERLDRHTCRFTADVYDSEEMIPWIRTFLCRIKTMDFSNRTAENQFKQDVEDMYRLYGLGGDA